MNPLARNFISELRNEGNNHFAKFPVGAIQEARVQGMQSASHDTTGPHGLLQG
jgi:hypothetical protein